MNNQVNTIKPILKISIPSTLLAIKVGETVLLSSKLMKSSSIRAAASRLGSANKAQFIVSEQGFVNEIQVTRTE